MEDHHDIFVYGSLREGFYNYCKYLYGNVISKNYSLARGSLYHLENKGYPAFIPGDHYVFGELYKFSIPFDRIIETLDQLENYIESDVRHSEYLRKKVLIFNIDKSLYERVFMYIYNTESIFACLDIKIEIPHGDWKKYLHEKFLS